MLKITQIKSLGEQTSKELSSISVGYLSKIKSATNPHSQLSKVLEDGLLDINGGEISQVNNPDEWHFLEYIEANFDQIITDTPDQLNVHIANLDNSLIGNMVATPIGGQRFQLTPFGKRIYEMFGYESHFRTKANKGIWLAKQLNIRTCPYCNGQYTLVVKKNTKGFRARFQFDHFFSKKKYPYLSLSLYNLIPSCASCNLSKGDSSLQLDTHYHPYYNNLSEKAHFRTEHKIDLKKLSLGQMPVEGLSIKFSAIDPADNDIVEAHNNMFDIESSYNRCLDIVEDLLSKAILYNNEFKDDVMKIKGLFSNDESLYYRYILGNYGLEAEIPERPLSKFTQDIAKQFGIL